MKHFGVTEADLKKVLTVALEKGGIMRTFILSTLSIML